MANIESVVRVTIQRVTNTATVRDLNTIAILSKHTNFAVGVLAKEYTSTTEMLNDGFEITEFAYIAAQRAFSQNPRPTKVVVGFVGAAVIDGAGYVGAINDLMGYNNKWLWLITDAGTQAIKESIAEFIETQEKYYAVSDSSVGTLNPALSTDLASVLKANNYEHSFVFYRKSTTDVAPEAAMLGRFANGIAGATLFLYKELAGLTAENFTPTEVSTLNTKNVTFYTTVEDDSVVFGAGKVAGGEWIHVMLGCTYIITRMRERLWGSLKSAEKISFTNQGITVFESGIRSVLADAVTNEILANDTPIDLQMPKSSDFTSAERQSGVLSKIKFRARLAGAIVKVDGIEGEVYA